MTKEEFKQIRTMLGESQPAFAERLGYKTYITILYKEKGARTITRRDEKMLAKYIGKKRKVA